MDNNNNYFQGQTPPPQGGQVPPQGGQQNFGQAPPQNQGYPPQYNAPVRPNQYAEAPPEIKKWNWGAFMFSIFWGIGNNAYLTLLCLVPCLNFVWVFVCGAMGNQWAWKSGEFKDVEQFMAVQRTWNKAGFVSFIITLIVIVIYIIMFIAMGAAMFSIFDNLSSTTYY